MKKFICLVACLFPLTASAFSGKLTSSANKAFDTTKDHEEVIGFALSNPIGMGFAWWNWTGGGMVTMQDESTSKWASHVEGFDWSAGLIKIGIKGKYDFDFEKQEGKPEVGASASIKLF